MGTAGCGKRPPSFANVSDIEIQRGCRRRLFPVGSFPFLGNRESGGQKRIGIQNERGFQRRRYLLQEQHDFLTLLFALANHRMTAIEGLMVDHLQAGNLLGILLPKGSK